MKRVNLVSRSPVLTAPALPSFLFRMVPWLKLMGALLAFVVISLYAAINSELGRPLTSGESPAFSVAKTYPGSLLLFGLGYLLLASGLQVLGFRRLHLRYTRRLQILAGLELLAVGILAVAVLLSWDGGLSLGHTLLQGSLICQVFSTASLFRPSQPISSVELLDLKVQAPFLFLFFLFLLAAVPASLNPSQRHIEDYVQLDSSLEILLIHVLPPLFSGIIGLWFGMATLVLLVGCSIVWLRIKASFRETRFLNFLPFLSVSGLYTGIFLASVIYSTNRQPRRSKRYVIQKDCISLAVARGQHDRNAGLGHGSPLDFSDPMAAHALKCRSPQGLALYYRSFLFRHGCVCLLHRLRGSL